MGGVTAAGRRINARIEKRRKVRPRRSPKRNCFRRGFLDKVADERGKQRMACPEHMTQLFLT